MTSEARVLRQMRIDRGLSMRKAGELIGLSDSYIAHIETGRLDPPQGERLDRVLSAYGGIKQKSFYDKVRQFSETLTPRDELLERIERMSEEKVKLVLGIVKSLPE
jgi:transcriptional regulator with XRE-family HTH domain